MACSRRRGAAFLGRGGPARARGGQSGEEDDDPAVGVCRGGRADWEGGLGRRIGRADWEGGLGRRIGKADWDGS